MGNYNNCITHELTAGAPHRYPVVVCHSCNSWPVTIPLQSRHDGLPHAALKRELLTLTDEHVPAVVDSSRQASQAKGRTSLSGVGTLFHKF